MIPTEVGISCEGDYASTRIPCGTVHVMELCYWWIFYHLCERVGVINSCMHILVPTVILVYKMSVGSQVCVRIRSYMYHEDVDMN